MTTFSQRNQAAIRAIMADAVRTIHWRYIEYLYGETAIGVVTWAATSGPTTTVLDIAPESWANAVFAAAIGQDIACYHGATRMNAVSPIRVSEVNVAHHRLTVRGNVCDLDELLHLFKSGREHPVTLHPAGARR